MKVFAILPLVGSAFLAACQGPAAKAGEEQDKASAAATGKPYSGEGPNEKAGQMQDRADKAKKKARDSRVDALKQQSKPIRTDADNVADKLEA